VQIHFEELFRLRINHDYYARGFGDDLGIIPSAETNRILTDYGILFRTVKGGAVLLYELQPATGKPMRPILESKRFRFLLKNRNPKLHHITELPLEDFQASIYHFHNFNDNKQSSELLLTGDSTTKYLSDTDRLPLRSQWFEYTFSVSGATADVRVDDFFGDQVLDTTVEKRDGEFSLPVDLQAYPPGRFTLSVNGSTELEFYADSSLTGRGYFGIIEIYRDAGVPGDYRFTEPDGDVQSRMYTINLQRRSTFWKYLVVLQYRTGLDPEDLSISHPDSGVSFQRRPALTLSDGSTAVPFISSVALPYRESPTQGIQLSQSNGNGSLLQIDDLPNASSLMIMPDPTADKIYSEIYYYI